MLLVKILDRSKQDVWVNLDKLVSIRKTREHTELQFDNSPPVWSSESVDDLVSNFTKAATLNVKDCGCK